MEIYQYFDTRYPRANTYWQIPRIYTDILFHFEFTSYNKYELRLLHMMNVRFSLLNMAQRILGVTLPNF